MKRNALEKESLSEAVPGSTKLNTRLPLEPRLELADRRWELAPIMLDGQNVGWRVVKILNPKIETDMVKWWQLAGGKRPETIESQPAPPGMFSIIPGYCHSSASP
jgi:hypothetical protein